jgi:hypothetical protein
MKGVRDNERNERIVDGNKGRRSEMLHRRRKSGKRMRVKEAGEIDYSVD